MARPKNITPTVKLTCSGSGIWSCYWQDSKTGKTIRRGCDGAAGERAAREIAHRRYLEWVSPPPPETATVGFLLDSYVESRTGRGKSYSPSFEHNLRHVRTFFAGYAPDRLTADAWDAYRDYRTGMAINNAASKVAAKNGKPVRYVSDATAVRELNALRGAIGWARERQWPGFKGVVMVLRDVETHPRHEFLTRPEFERLIAALKSALHLELFCRLAVATGARMSALLELKWTAVHWPMNIPAFDIPEDMDPDATKDLLTYDTLNKRWTLCAPIEIDMGRGKGNKKRPSGLVSPTNIGLWRTLVRAYHARKSGQVIEYRGKPIKSVDLSDAFERANIPHAKRTQHVLKHTCCSWLVQAGRRYADIAKLVGTSAQTIERHYGHLSPEHLGVVGEVLSI